MIAVIETSALMRLFIPDGPLPDGFEAFLRGVERGANQAIAPELMPAEVGNVTNKKRIQGVLSMEESVELIRLAHNMPIRYFSHLDLLEFSLTLAAEHEVTVYDALYLALARRKSASLFTADEKMRAAADRLGLLP